MSFETGNTHPERTNRWGQIDLTVEERNRAGMVLSEDTLSDPEFQTKITNILEEPQYSAFVDDIRNGVKVGFGTFRRHKTLSIFVFSGIAAAIAVATEIGPRHGKDVRDIIDFLNPQNTNQPEKS